MNKPPSQWRGGAGGAPILSQPIVDYRRYPFGSSRKTRWWEPVAAYPIVFVLKLVVLVLDILIRITRSLNRPSKWEYRELNDDKQEK